MQRKFRFVADQRWDLPHYNEMMNLIESEFRAYNRAFISSSNKVVKNWKIENAGGLIVRVNNSTDSVLFNTERAGYEDFHLRLSTDELLTLTLADNAVNYVELEIFERGCATDTVALWDTTANSGQGQEYTQSVDTITEQAPVLVSNTIAFTGLGNRVPLARVTTASGVITSIEDVRDFLFHLDEDYDFGLTRTDKNISSIKEMYNAITTSIKEMKGLPNWYDNQGINTLNLLERLNYLLVDGGTISWQKNSPNEVSWSESLRIIAPSKSFHYTISAQTISNFLDGEILYVTLPKEGVAPTGPLLVQKTTTAAYQLNSENTRNYIVGYRSGQKLYFGNGWQSIELESGEQSQLGDGITQAWIVATGLSGESDDTPPYTSTFFITPGTSFTQAISQLDVAMKTAMDLLIGPIYEQSIFVPSGGYAAGTLIPLPLNRDYQLFYNQVELMFDGAKKFLGDDYLEVDDGGGVGTKLQLLYAVPEGVRITFRIQTGGTAIGGGSLSNIATDPQPVTNGLYALGSATKAWSGLYLKDEVTDQVYRIFIANGVLDIAEVPSEGLM